MKTLIDLSSEIFDVEGLLHVSDAENVIESNGCTSNFNRDIDALCFKNALTRFVRTGARDDAFDVFFCYAEIFKTFGGYKNGIDSLLKLLYQHESTSASLLEKHRDHYSHSAYVFALGLAIFMNNKNMRDAFAFRYGTEKLYYNFIKYWGMASLFHDVGYPYEISYTQVYEYNEKIDNCKERTDENSGNGADINETKKDDSKRIKMQYTNLEGFVALSDDEVQRCERFMPAGKKDINSIFAAQILKTFGAISGFDSLDERIVRTVIEDQVTKSKDKYMDHGYFSAVLVLKKLLKNTKFVLDQPTLDAIMAMFLHNSFYKYTYRDEIKGKNLYHHLRLKEQPLAYLLMLCDELQCWDRVPYGKLSKMQELAWDIDIDVDDDYITMTYYFNDGKPDDTKKIDRLVADINKDVIDTDEIAVLTATHKRKHKDKKVYDYLSDSKFIDLCKIAETINTSYQSDCKNAGIKEYMQSAFDSLTLEYKLSNVAQAKDYVRHLHKINCFFSDRKLDYPVVEEFTEKELLYLAKEEHIRWVAEKIGMGWKYGRQVEDGEIADETSYKDRTDREAKRLHKNIVPFCDLSEDAKSKDMFPVNNMVKQLRNYGIKIYRTNAVPDRKWTIAGLGHRDLTRIKGFDEEKVRSDIRKYIRRLQEYHELTAYSGCAEGADLLFAEEALKCGVDLIAVLPCKWEEFMTEHQDGGAKLMGVLGQAKEVFVKPDNESRYVAIIKTLIKECDELLIMWDGNELDLNDADGNPINRGGTFDAICQSEEAGKRIKYLCESR